MAVFSKEKRKQQPQRKKAEDAIHFDQSSSKKTCEKNCTHISTVLKFLLCNIFESYCIIQIWHEEDAVHQHRGKYLDREF